MIKRITLSILFGIFLSSHNSFGFNEQEGVENIELQTQINNLNVKLNGLIKSLDQNNSFINKYFQTVLTNIQINIISKLNTSSCYYDDVKIAIYMYHYIREENWDKKGGGIRTNGVSPNKFDQMLAKAKSKSDNEEIEIIKIDELDNYFQNRCFPNNNIIIFTSDDGWRDNYGLLYPITQKYKIPFAYGMIKNMISENRIAAMMTKEEYKILKEDEELVTVVSHTVNHLNLPDLYDQKLEEELCDSNKYFNSEIIVYPAGRYDDNVISKAKECGYKYGLTTIGGINTTVDLENNPFELKRIRVNRHSNPNGMFEF